MFWFFLFTLAIEALGTVGGFGSSLFFVPLARIWIDIRAVLALTSILHTFSNISKLILFGKTFDRFALIWIGIPSVALVIIGARLTQYADEHVIAFILAFFLIGFSTILLLLPHLRLPRSRAVVFTAGGFAGFLAGLTGTGGAIRGMALAALNIEKNAFVATSALIDTFVDFSRMIVYLSQSYLPSEYYWHIPLLAVAAFIGSYFGRTLLGLINQKTFRRIVLILILATGVLSLAQSIL